MAPSVSVTASFEKTGYEWAWTARDTTDRPDYTEYYSGLLTSAASGTAFSKDPNMYGRFNMTSTGSPGYDYRDAATTPYIDQGAPYTWTQVYVAGKPAGFENYPLYMMPLRFEAFVGQSSPFPCDDNTLTLFVQTNVPLLKACAPKLTLSGLTGSSTASNTADGASGFGVEFHVTPGYTGFATWRGDVATTAGTAVPKTGSGEGVTYSASSSTGLVLDLEKVLPDITAPSNSEKLESGDTNTDATVDQLYVTFVLKNKNGYNACASPQVRLGFTGCSTNTATQLQTTSGLTSESSLHLQSPADTSGHTGVFYPPGNSDGVTGFPSEVDVLGGFDSTRFYVDGTTFAEVQPGEGRPMCIRAPEFKCIPAHQSTKYPCAANTVTVTLQSFVPIFATCGSSPNKIEIRELDIFQTEADVAAINTAAAVTVDDGAQAGGDNSVATGAWTAETTIEVTMLAGQTMRAEEEFVVTFTRNNVQNRGANRGSEVNLAVALTTMTHTAQTSLPTGRPDPAIGTANSNGVQSPPHVEAATPYRINSCFDYLFLDEPGCMAQTIHQTSAYPCAENTVTVALRPDVPLLATCGNSAAARARPTITIAGFDRDQTYSRSTSGTPWHIWSGSTNGGNYKSMFTDVTTTDMVTDMAFLEGSAATAVADPIGSSGVQTLGVSTTKPEYNQVSGHVVIALDADWTAAMALDTTNYLAFQFKVKNSPRFSNDAPDVRVFVSGLENPASCHLGSLYIKDPYLATFSSVTQSSPYPCATNTITVDLWSSVPFLDDCVPKVTIAGLAGACTDSETTDASSLIGNQDPASGVDLATTGKTPTWTQNTGTLVVTMKAMATEDSDALRVEAAADGGSPGPAAGISGEFYASGAPTRTMPDPVYGTEQSLASAAGIEYEYIDTVGTRSIKYFRRSFTLTLTNAATDRDAGQVTLRASFNMASNAQDWCQVRDSQWSDLYGPPAGFAVSNGAYCDQIELRSEGWDEATLSRTTGTHPTGTLWDTFRGRPYYDFAEYTNYGDLPWQVPDTDYPSELGASTSAHALYAPFPKPVDYARYPTYVMPVRLRAFAAQSSPFPCDTANTITVWVQTNVPLLKRCQPKLTVSNLRGRQESGAITVTTHTGGTSIGGDKAGSYTGAWTYGSSGSKMVLDLVPASSPMLDGTEPQVLATFGTADVDASGGIAAAITAAETASPAEHDLATVDVLLMTFPIENQRNARDYAIPNVEIKLATTDNTDTGTECAIGVSQTTVTTDYGMDGGTPAADGASQMLLEWPGRDGPYLSGCADANRGYSNRLDSCAQYPVGQVADGTTLSTGRAWSGPQLYENRPGYVRAASLWTHLPSDGAYVDQTTPYPCAANTVTVTLHSYVPVFATCRNTATPAAGTAAADESTIRIGGLNIFQLDAGLATGDVDVSDTTVLEVKQVTETEILLQVKSGQTLVADKAYTVKLRRFNHQKERYASPLDAESFGRVNAQICTSAASASDAGAYLSTSATYKPQDSTSNIPDQRAYAQCTGGIMPTHAEYEYQELYVLPMLWTSASAVQKTQDGRDNYAYPCDETTITLSLSTWTPLLATCGHDSATQTRPKITIALKGVEKTITADAFVTASVKSGATDGALAATSGNPHTVGAGGFAASGVLTVTLESTAGGALPTQDAGDTSTTAETWTNWDSTVPFYVEFKVINSKTWGYRWPEVSIDQVTSPDSPLDPWSPVWGADWDLSIETPFIDSVSAVTVATSPAAAGQPCAMATIQVHIRTTVPLLTACAPQITITGLASSQPNADDAAPVAAAVTGQTALTVGTAPTWNKATGTLVATIADDATYAASVPNGAVNAHDTYFQFDLRNPKEAYRGNGYAISISLEGQAAGTNTVVNTGSKKLPYALRYEAADALDRPQYVEQPVFDLTVVTSDAAPCALNTVTLTINSNVDIQGENCCAGTSASAEPTTFTISGFQGATKTAAFALLETSTTYFDVANAAFDDSTGTLTVALADTLPKDTDHVLTFTLKNDVTARAADLVAVTANCVSIISTAAAGASRHGVLVQNPLPTGACMEQTTAFPSALNTITLTFSSGFSAKLYSACKPSVVVTGLTGAAFCDGHPPFAGGADDGSFVLRRYGATGLNLTATSDIAVDSNADKEVKFQFYNPVAKQNAPTMKLQMYYDQTLLPGQLTVTTCSGGSKVLKVDPPAFIGAPAITASSKIGRASCRERV